MIKTLFNPHHFLKKPTAYETAAIVSNIKQAELSPSELRNFVSSGITLRPAILDDNGNFIEQSLFCVDVDNKNNMRRVQDNLDICEKLNLTPMVVYKTFSGNYENQKHRLIFLFDKTIKDIQLRNEAIYKLNAIFSGDNSTRNLKRLFYGGNLCYFFAPNAEITVSDLNKAFEGSDTYRQ